MENRSATVNSEKVRSLLQKAFEHILDETFPDTVHRPMDDVKRPREGTICASIWDFLDSTLTKDYVPKVGDALKIADEKKWNVATVRTQYGAWRKANGIPSQQ